MRRTINIFLIVIFYLFAHFTFSPLLPVKWPRTIYAQDFDEEDFSDDESDEEESDEEDEVEEEEQSEEEEVTQDENQSEESKEEKQLETEQEDTGVANQEDEFSDEDEVDKRLEEEEELERQKELAEEEARRKKEQEELAKSEERIRKMQEEEEKRRKEERRKRLMRIKEEERYRAYFYKKAEEAKLDSQLPPRVGFAWSFLIGFEPNLGNSANEGFTFGNQIPFPTASQYLNQTPNKGGAAIANAFQSSVNELNSLLPEGSKEAKVTDSSASLSAFPIAAAAYYYSETYMVRLGVHFSWSVIGLGGTNRFVFYNDSGQELYLEHKMKMIRFHIPLSFALRLLASKKYGAFVGGGPSFFYGVNISTFDSNQTTTYPDPTAGTITTTRKGGTENFITEEDIFQATALGFHILVGIEAEVYKGFMVSVELYQTFGSSGLVEDRKLNARTESTLGTAETDRADAISLNFSGTQILFGVKRFL